MLQSPILDFSKAVDLVYALVDTSGFRQKSYFDNIWDEVLSICEQCEASVVSCKTTKKAKLKLSQCSVLTSVGQSMPEQDKDHYRTNFFYPVIDLMLNELDRRFSKANCDLMNSIQALNPKNDAFLKETALLSFAKLLDSDTDDLGHELHQFRRI